MVRRRSTGEVNDLTLEKLEVAKRLGGLEVKMAEFITRFDAHMEQEERMFKELKILVERHENILHGDTNGNSGLVLHVDRINQKEKSRVWTFRALWASIIALTTKWVGHIFWK